MLCITHVDIFWVPYNLSEWFCDNVCLSVIETAYFRSVLLKSTSYIQSLQYLTEWVKCVLNVFVDDFCVSEINKEELIHTLAPQ